MPYELITKDGRYCVRKQGETENLKCYDEKGKATAYLRALYANVHESVEGASLSMHITKARVQDGKMVIKLTSSDTGKDFYDEAMSKELFDDFIGHININEGIPEPFQSAILEGESWQGGMPYISLAHYKSGADGVNVPGEIVSIGRDGDVLKAVGVLHDTPLGKAVFKSIQKDLVEKRNDKIRVSIGFLDMEHSHGDKFTFTRKSLTDKCRLCKEGVGDKIYKKGHLVHLALTRVPANPRTDVEVERSMTTKREDAESIIEDEEVIKALDLKSMAEDLLVVKTEDADADEMDMKDAKDAKKKKMDEMHNEMQKSITEPVVENTELSPVAPITVTPAPVYEVTPIEKSVAALVEKATALKANGIMGEDALKEMQSYLDNAGEVIKAEFTPAPDPAEVEKHNLETTLRSLFAEMLPQYLAQTVAPMQAKLDTLEGELRAKSLTTPQEKQAPVQTVQRSLSPALVARTNEVAKQTISQFDLIARQSVGLQ